MVINQDDIGNSISFTYNNRKVICTVKDVFDKIFIGILQTDYIGKNVQWLIGELKVFIIKNCK